MLWLRRAGSLHVSLALHANTQTQSLDLHSNNISLVAMAEPAEYFHISACLGILQQRVPAAALANTCKGVWRAPPRGWHRSSSSPQRRGGRVWRHHHGAPAGGCCCCRRHSLQVHGQWPSNYSRHKLGLTTRPTTPRTARLGASRCISRGCIALAINVDAAQHGADKRNGQWTAAGFSPAAHILPAAARLRVVDRSRYRSPQPAVAVARQWQLPQCEHRPTLCASRADD